MTKNAVESSPRLYSTYWASLTFGSIFLATVEAGRYFAAQHGEISLSHTNLAGYLFGIYAITLLSGFLNLGLPAFALASVPTKSLWHKRLCMLAAVIFGIFWHATTMQGDGIQSHPWFELLRFGSLVVAVVGLAVFSRFVLFPGHLSRCLRRIIVSLCLAAALATTLFVLPLYTAFHGYLIAAQVILIIWLTYDFFKTHPRVRASFVALSLLVIMGWLFLPRQDSAARHVQRFSHISRSFGLGMWASRVSLFEETDSYFAPPTHFDGDVGDVQYVLEQAKDSVSSRPLGRNIILIVLESVRADIWMSDDFAPRFHSWRNQGVYFPRAVAQYPATPLAYGSMFVSQPPSVLVNTAKWANNRPFDEIRGQFDHLFLSKPRVEWFEHTAITDFFIPDDIQAHKHATGKKGLEYLREAILGVNNESFFGWVHLYEPHAPYRRHPTWASGRTGLRGAYASEVGYIDAQLGDFMEWFYEQPQAKDTLVIVIGDHGEGLGETIAGQPFWGHHVHVHNVVSWVPAYFSGPGLPKGELRANVNMGQVDIMPTMMDFVGTEVPEEMPLQGWSIYRLLEDEPNRPMVSEAFSIRGRQFFDYLARMRSQEPESNSENFRKALHTEHYSPKISLQYEQWKIHFDRTLGRYQLYDINDDPLEQHDLARDKPDVLGSMRQQLQEWQKRQALVIDSFNSEVVQETDVD